MCGWALGVKWCCEEVVLGTCDTYLCDGRFGLTGSNTLVYCTITEKSAVAFSLGDDNLKRYFDQR